MFHLGDDADDFAADTRRARLAIGHHAMRRRHDRDAEAVHHARNVVFALVDPQSGLRDALDALDDRLPRVVAERDLELRLARFLAGDLEALDVALVLQNAGDRDFDLRRRHHDHGALRHLRVADARQHVGDGITHAHALLLPAGFHDAGNFAAHRVFAQLVAPESELAVHA